MPGAASPEREAEGGEAGEEGVGRGLGDGTGGRKGGVVEREIEAGVGERDGPGAVEIVEEIARDE